ncbi:hypothetical protein Lal_00027144 [Lupinus albus]|nr:hypothetical protein Lal_00027144 [Lupinus albus]
MEKRSHHRGWRLIEGRTTLSFINHRKPPPPLSEKNGRGTAIYSSAPSSHLRRLHSLVDHNNNFQNLRIISTLPTQSSKCACQEEHFGKLSLCAMVLMRTTCANKSLKIINKSTCLSLPIDLGISKEQRFLAGATAKERFSLSRIMRAHAKKVCPREFKEGDLVLKKILPIQKDHRGKWTPNYEGPYVVKKAFSGGALILTNMDG